MSYAHAKVEHVEKTTKGILAQLSESDPPPALHVDGIPVTRQMAQFCAEIRKVNRHAKFGVSKATKTDWVQGTPRYRELYVYMDGHMYVMMRIGYADYSTKGNGDSKFMVYARMIKNEKFRDENDQYHMATAEGIERAVKNIKKYMRPYSPIECAEMSFGSVRSKFSSVVSDVSSGLSAAKYGATDSAHLRNELFHMLDVGYEFLSEDFKNKIVVWRDAYRADQESKGRALHVYYVNVRLYREEMVCDVIEVLDANKRSHVDVHVPVSTYSMSDLPENIAGNLAALSMVDDDHYVDGVGLRVDSTTFWVQR
jgi:hypothetical protein